MWLYVPFHCLQESAHSTSESDSPYQDFARSVTWKGKHMPPPFWSRAFRTATWTKLLSTMTFANSWVQAGVDRWISSLEESPASPTPSPAREKATKTTAPSGQNSPESWPSVDPPWSSSRTSQLSFLGEDFGLSERNYADWVTKSKIRSSSMQATLARLTSASGSSSSPTIWQTPKDSSGGNVSRSGDRKDELLLAGQAEQWPTASARDRKDGRASDATMEKNARPLNEVVDRWPTPKVSEWKGADPARSENKSGLRHSGDGLSTAVDVWPTPRTITGGAESQSRKQELGRKESGGGDLQSAVEGWPTPTAQDSESHGSAPYTTESGRHSGTTLTDKTREFEERGRWGENQYPTPSATPYGSGQNEGAIDHVRPSRGTPSLFQWASTHQAQKISTSGEASSSGAPTSRRRLNPAFVCWLQGWPWFWTRTERINSDAQEMVLFPPKPDGRS